MTPTTEKQREDLKEAVSLIESGLQKLMLSMRSGDPFMPKTITKIASVLVDIDDRYGLGDGS